MGGDSWGVFVGVTPPPPSPFTSLEIPVDRLHQFLNKILSLTLHLKTPHWPLRIFNNPLGVSMNIWLFLEEHYTNWLISKVLFEIYLYLYRYLVPSKPS